MTLINHISYSLQQHNENACFCIDDIFYSYKQFSQLVSNIRFSLKKSLNQDQLNIGLTTYDDIETYASIFALWLEGRSYIPINPTSPAERNKFILNSTASNTILSSNKLNEYELDFTIISSRNLDNQNIDLEPSKFSQERLAYILFTSGSTGSPKGVPISFNNLNHLVKNIECDTDHKIHPEDKCLQMFDLTFDFSVVTYLLPLLNGACVFTIPPKKIKYLYIYKMMLKHNLTYLIMVPSIIHYLKPYFDEIDSKSVRYCCFGAAPLNIDILELWKKSIPNAKLYNSYGPTEFTVTTSYYSFQKNTTHKTKNGIVSLGKSLQNVTSIVVDDDLNILPHGQEGELCLAGEQQTSGYLKDKEKNSLSFFEKNYNNQILRFYKTGDLCILDQDGDILFIGRKDFQVKIRGYRVELAEIEYHVKSKSKKGTNIIAIDIVNALGNTELGLAIESEPEDTKPLVDYLKTKVPDYMVPTQIIFIKEFPHNTNGKIDRKQLRTYFLTN